MASPDSAAKSAAASATSAAASAQAAATALENTVEVAGLPTEAAAQTYNIENDPGVKGAMNVHIDGRVDEVAPGVVGDLVPPAVAAEVEPIAPASGVRAVGQGETAINIQDAFPWGQVGNGDSAIDTAALQAAVDSNANNIILPKHASPNGYIFDTVTIQGVTKARRIVGVGPASSVRVTHKSGSVDHLLKFLPETPPTPGDATTMLTDISLHNLNIIGNATAPGGLHFDGCYKIVVDNCDVRGYTATGAVGVTVKDCFNFTWKHGQITGMTAGVGIEFTGSLMQLTNCQMWDFLVTDSATLIKISTTIQGGGLHIFDGALILRDGGVGVDWTGKYANVEFSQVHVEAPEPTLGATAFKMSGSNLTATAVKFDGLDMVRVKTLFDLDGSTGVAKNMTFDNIYATGTAGMNGTAFKLNTIAGEVVFGVTQIDSGTIYSTVYDLTATTPSWGHARQRTHALLPNPVTSKGMMVGLTDQTWTTSRRAAAFSDGTEWRHFVGARDSDGRVDLPGDVLLFLAGNRLTAGSADPEGTAGAATGSVYLRTNGWVYRKNSGTGNTGWRLMHPLERTSAQIQAASDGCNSASAKWAGQTVYDTTLGRLLYASGSATTSPWKSLADDTTVHTPA